MNSGVVALAALAVALVWLIRRLTFKIGSNWPVVMGIITHSQLRTREADGASPGIYYYPEVQYRYSVEGQAYQGFRVSFSSVQTASPEQALELISRLAPGTSAPIRYNPYFPADSVMEGISI